MRVIKVQWKNIFNTSNFKSIHFHKEVTRTLLSVGRNGKFLKKTKVKKRVKNHKKQTSFPVIIGDFETRQEKFHFFGWTSPSPKSPGMYVLGGKILFSIFYFFGWKDNSIKRRWKECERQKGITVTTGFKNFPLFAFQLPLFTFRSLQLFFFWNSKQSKV